jgi:hypothetical protein
VIIPHRSHVYFYLIVGSTCTSLLSEEVVLKVYIYIYIYILELYMLIMICGMRLEVYQLLE